jgi:hypothetical protein
VVRVLGYRSVRFPALPDFLKKKKEKKRKQVVDLERELLDRKVAAPV